MIKLPNLLATRNGRLTAFFMLYVTEGIPLGFAATAVAAQLRRMGVGPAEVGAFVASFYLPWAFKWAFGPFIDTFRSKRFGHRRAWIIGTQIMLVLTLLALIPVPLPSGLGLFTGILLVHNTFGAMQDVAIDALAVASLDENERGLANGLMFAGASVGQGIGGSAVLYLIGITGLQGSYVVVAASIALVTLFVALPMKEAVVGQLAAGKTALQDAAKGAAGALASATQSAQDQAMSWAQAYAQMRLFAVDSFRSFVGSRPAFSAVFVALGPMGAMALGGALQSNMGVELGMTDTQIGDLALVSNITGGVFMVAGGWLADRLGRLRMVSLYLALTSLPVFYLAWKLQQAGYVMPRKVGSAAVPELITLLWWTSMAYYVAQGLMYGARMATYMDVTNPKVAATQFTAYMAMMNLAIAIANTWQGVAVETFGYPITLLLDGVLALAFISLNWFMRRPAGQDPSIKGVLEDGLATQRAKRCAAALGVICLLWLPVWHWRTSLGEAQPLITGTFFTLVFVVSALFLLAGREVLGNETPAWWRKAAPWVALWLMLMYMRGYLGNEAASTLYAPLQALYYLGPLVGAGMLFALARQGWGALRRDEKP